MSDRTVRPAPMTQEERLKKAIALLQQIKQKTMYIESEGRTHKSQQLVDLSFEIDGACTDALNALFGVKPQA